MNIVLCIVAVSVLTSPTIVVPADPKSPGTAANPTPAPTQDPDCPANCTCERSHTVINCDKLDHVPVFRNRSVIKEFQISPNGITELGADTLAGFTSLLHLDLANGRISTLDKDAFRDVKATVTMINLVGNNITTIPGGTFNDFPNLLKLDLSANPLKTIRNSTLVNLPALKDLYFQRCSLTAIEPAAFQGLSSLLEIHFAINHLTEIPFPALASVPNIQMLELRFNRIAKVPETAPYVFPNLTELQLDSNKLSFVTFPNMSPSLKILDLAFTALTSISAQSWKHVPLLEELELSGLHIPEIKQGMFHGLTKLQRLFIKGSIFFTSIGKFGFDGLSSLTKADLSNNGNLRSIHSTAFTNTSITALFLDNTAVSTFQADLVPWSTMENVDLVGTPLVCNCSIRWMLNLHTTGPRVENHLKTLQCKAPPLLVNKKVVTLPPRALSCPGERTLKSSMSRTTTGLIVASVCTITAGIFVLLFKCRHRIRMSVRRYFQYRRYKNDMVFMVENDTSIGELEDGDAKPMKEMRLETVPLTD